MANVTSSFDDHLVSVEDAQTGTLFHFAASKTKGFRFIGAQPRTPSATPPDHTDPFYPAAEFAARDYARQMNWI